MTEQRVTTTLESMDIQQLMLMLPHRYPFLMIDRIVDIDGDNSAVGIKNVSINEPHFQGHFPARAVMPGVLILEAMAQTAGAICIAAAGKGPTPTIVYLTSIDSARFRRPVVPGDVLLIKVRKLRQRMNLWRFSASAEVDGVVAAEAELSAVVSDTLAS